MHSTQINYLTEAGRTTYEYRPRVSVLAPQVGLWCLLTGAPLGLASATGLAVFDLITTAEFAETAVALAIIIAAMLYVLVIILPRSKVVLSVTFDVLAGTAEIYRRHGHPPFYRCALLDVASFHTDTIQSGFQRTCAMTMTRTGKQVIPLIEVDERCHPESELINLMERLNIALDASQNEITNPPPLLMQQQAYVPPTALRPAIPLPRHHDIQPPADEDYDHEYH